MKRRDALKTMGTAAVGTLAASTVAKDLNPLALNADSAVPQANVSGSKKIRLGEGGFLSNSNPIANQDTKELEELAMEIAQWPVIKQARANAEMRFKIAAKYHNPPEEAWHDWEGKLDEWVMHYSLMALNSDSNYPKVLMSEFGPPHEWFGRKVPGCRGPGTMENVDNNYGVIPIDGKASFRLYGQRFENGVGDFPLHITANLSHASNVSGLTTRDIQINDDGSFVVTIDPEPANGRPNHLQTSPDTRWLLIRDGRMEWEQTPNAYLIERVDPPTHRPRTLEELAEVAARFIIDDVAISYWYKAAISSLDPNSVSPIQVGNAIGGMNTVWLMRGRVEIQDDEAFVLTLTDGGAAYMLLVSYNWWGMSGNYWDKSSSLNKSQSVANDDGSYTFVFSIKDPGVHNWIDTLGLHESLFLTRWQLLPESPGGGATAKTQVVKLSELDSVLPAGTKRVTPKERQQQLAKRSKQFKARYKI